MTDRRSQSGFWNYVLTAAVVTICGVAGWLCQRVGVSEANIVMIFLLGVVVVATRYGRGPAIAAAVANVLVFDFCFVPPQFSFTVNDAQYLWTFAVMLGIGLLVSTLTARVEEQLRNAHEARLRVQTEQLRNSLLSSVSHDLRTPLATIAGTASSLLEHSSDRDAESRRELLQSMVEESHRLARLVDNLLEMTRLEAGPITLNRQWHVLEELVGSALARVRREVARHNVRVHLPTDLPLVSLDGLLFEQALVNLLENAARYTPPGSVIEISARLEENQIEIRVADNGPGLAPGHELRVFEKFFRAASNSPDSRRGVGLGLAICQQIVRAHGGSITARNRSTGGAEFLIILPCSETPPTVTLD